MAIEDARMANSMLILVVRQYQADDEPKESYNDDNEEFIHVPYVLGGSSFEQSLVYIDPSTDKPSTVFRLDFDEHITLVPGSWLRLKRICFLAARISLVGINLKT